MVPTWVTAFEPCLAGILLPRNQFCATPGRHARTARTRRRGLPAAGHWSRSPSRRRLAAGAAEEDAAEGKKRITPYWRTLKTGGVLNEKYPGGVQAQKKRLEQEGHSVMPKGKKHVVEDFEKHLARL